MLYKVIKSSSEDLFPFYKKEKENIKLVSPTQSDYALHIKKNEVELNYTKKINVFIDTKNKKINSQVSIVKSRAYSTDSFRFKGDNKESYNDFYFKEIWTFGEETSTSKWGVS